MIVVQDCEWLIMNAIDAGTELFSVRVKNCSETVLLVLLSCLFFEVTSSFTFEVLLSKLVLMYVNTDVVYRGYSKDNVKQTLYLTSGDFTGSVDSIEAVQ